MSDRNQKNKPPQEQENQNKKKNDEERQPNNNNSAEREGSIIDDLDKIIDETDEMRKIKKKDAQ